MRERRNGRRSERKYGKENKEKEIEKGANGRALN